MHLAPSKESIQVGSIWRESTGRAVEVTEICRDRDSREEIVNFVDLEESNSSTYALAKEKFLDSTRYQKLLEHQDNSVVYNVFCNPSAPESFGTLTLTNGSDLEIRVATVADYELAVGKGGFFFELMKVKDLILLKEGIFAIQSDYSIKKVAKNGQSA